MLIIQATAKQYRSAFFDMLKDALQKDGISLSVAYSEPNELESKKDDNIELSAAYGIKVKRYWLLRNRFLLQLVFREIAQADLVIVEQANKHLINYYLLLLSALKCKKVAFWGHGRNRQSEHKLFGWLKRKMIDKVDWWFAYTAGTKDYLAANGMPPHLITNVQNSIDTNQLKDDLKKLSESRIETEKGRLGLDDASRVGLFCGALYPLKCLDFLIVSGKIIKAQVPAFELIIIGAGPDATRVKRAASREPWIHYLGPKFDTEKAIFFRMSEVFLMPGLVGLSIIDAFTAGLPIVTTDIPFHSPEIEYLQNGQNGVMVQHDVSFFAQAAIGLFSDGTGLRRMQLNAKKSADLYSIDAMVNNFKVGVHKIV